MRKSGTARGSGQCRDRLSPQRLGGCREHELFTARAEFRAAPVTDPATRALDHRDQCQIIVRLQRDLDNQIAVAGGEHAVEIAVAAKATQRALRAQRIETPALIGAEAVGGRGVDAGGGKIAAGTGAGHTAVEHRGLALAANPAFVQRGRLDDSEHRPLAAPQGDQRSEQRKAADVTLGAIDRVEHPGEFTAGLGSEFLALDAVRGKRGTDHTAHFGFDRAIGQRYGAVIGLVLDHQRLAKVPACNAAGGIGQLRRQLQSLGALRVIGELHRPEYSIGLMSCDRKSMPERRGAAF
jgi:hypothetical protein